MKKITLKSVMAVLVALFSILPQIAKGYTFKVTTNGVAITYYAESSTSTTCVVGSGTGYLAINPSTTGNLIIPSTVYYNGKECHVIGINDFAFYGCNGLASVTIPYSVTSIGDLAFYGCTGLTSMIIPNSVTTIGSGILGGCENLESISVESENTVYDSREGCNAIIKTSTNTLIAGCKNTSLLNSVTNIGNLAFYGQKGLNSIIIPNSVTTIGTSAFEDCSGITSVTIPNTVISIGEYNQEIKGETNAVAIPVNG